VKEVVQTSSNEVLFPAGLRHLLDYSLLDFDNVLVLDCLRYDTACKFSNILGSKPEKAFSTGYCTQVFYNTLCQYLDLRDWTLVSAHPGLNSRGLNWSRDVVSQFKEIIDVWDEGWAHDLGTIPPKAVWRLLGQRLRTRRNLWVHHEPDFSNYSPEKRKEDELRTQYEVNATLALADAKMIRELLPGSLAIISDHGELLGEDGEFGHAAPHPLLYEIPVWLFP